MDFITALEKALGKKAVIELQPLQLGDVQETYADVSDLFTEFQFKPATSIEEGVINFVAWYRDFYIKSLK
jgi:UDP-glucuronate 4-epimerase